ncbi:MAG: response regulator, partial [Salibacteraceae bacterium]
MSKVLIIDDERPIRNSLRDILEYEKLKIQEATNGIEALELISKTAFDLILCDIKMPGMDGIELLTKIQKSHPEVPVIMISGHGNVETAVDALKKGAYDFIEKPIDLNRLLVTVRNALDRASLVAETKTLRKKLPQSKESP